MQVDFRSVRHMALLGADIGVAWGALSAGSGTSYAFELGRLIADALIGAIAGALIVWALPKSK